MKKCQKCLKIKPFFYSILQQFYKCPNMPISSVPACFFHFCDERFLRVVSSPSNERFYNLYEKCWLYNYKVIYFESNVKTVQNRCIIDFSNLPHDTSTAINIIDFCSQGQRSPASKLYIVEKPHKHTHQELVPLYTRIFFRIETLHTYQELNTQHKHIYKTTLLHFIKNAAKSKYFQEQISVSNN